MRENMKNTKEEWTQEDELEDEMGLALDSYGESGSDEDLLKLIRIHFELKELKASMVDAEVTA